MLLLLFLCTVSAEFHSTRLVLTFENQSDAASASDLLDSVRIVKQYGRRLVADVGRAAHLESDGQQLRRLLNRSVSIELDHVILTSTTVPVVYSDAVAVVNGSYDEALFWNLAMDEPYGIHVEASWQLTNSTPDITVAVLDSGLAALTPSPFLHLAAGYDFISDPALAMDGDGRDPDSTDPGDSGSECPAPSWHGTRVASILAANHGTGMLGVASNCTVLPVRVLGMCGMGYASDVADALVWAAGGVIDGVGANPTPSDIVVMSFAGVASSCPSYLQSAVALALDNGVLPLAASGNDGLTNTTDYFPANCVGVMAIAASTRQGMLAEYSNYGSDVALAAPGGDALNPIATLTMVGGNLTLAYDSIGTSFGVPHVAGVAALLVALYPGMNLRGMLLMNNTPCALGKCEIISAEGKMPDYNRSGTYVESVASYNQTITVSAQEIDPELGTRPGAYTTTWQCSSGNFVNGISAWAGQRLNTLIMQCTGGAQFTYSGSGGSYISESFGTGMSQVTIGYDGDSICSLVLFPDSQTTPLEMIGGNCGSGGSGPYQTTTQTCYSGEKVIGFILTLPSNPDAVYQLGIICGPIACLGYEVSPSYCTCPAGSWIAPRSGGYYSCSSCPESSMCTAGQYLSGCGGSSVGTCAPCTNMPSSGYYYTGLGNLQDACPYAACISCGPGATLTGCGGTSPGSCASCGSLPVAYYYSTYGSCNQVLCTNANSGQYYTSSGGTSNNCGTASCASCNPGQLNSGCGLTSPGFCQSCSGITAGSYFTTRSSCNTATCAAGTYSTGTMSTVCTSCWSNSNSPSGASSCACNAGYYGTASCTLCPAGSSCVQGVKSACPQGQYSAAGATVCVMCSAGTYGGQTGLSVCAKCAAGSYTPGQGYSICNSCNAGLYSATQGLTLCSQCSAGTYASQTSSSACGKCALGTYTSQAASFLCLQCAAGLFAGTTGASVCAQCAAGKYTGNAGLSACASCGAGKYSNTLGAASADACVQCPTGSTTRPTDSGLTSCVSCASLHQPVPVNALFVAVTDPLLCSWVCNAGYTLVNYSQASYVASAYTSLGYTSAEALTIFHIANDYCCNPTIVDSAGVYLNGCSRTSDGTSAPCAAIADGYYVLVPVPKLSRCMDWACNYGYYSNGTNCLQQQACKANYTYARDTSGNLLSSSVGAFSCVPCSRCMDGSEVLVPCNGTVDTQCAMCSGTTFSAGGSPCVDPVPLGFIGVIVRLTSMPVFQGRPVVMSDGITPVDWEAITGGSGLFINTYTPCQPIPSSSMYIGGDVPCRRLDTQAGAVCNLPSCYSQCRPWNGTAGWYMLHGQCTQCEYDPTCSTTQYSDMTTCGPTLAPLCVDCPSIPLPNAVGWTNPGMILRSTQYPCTAVCKNGYINFNNTECIACPSLPNNSKVVGADCAWTCSLGYQQSGASLCAPCVGVPTSCQSSTYLGYASGAQCARCLPCTNVVANSVYISAGLPNGPDTCALLCDNGFFIAPQYGLDIFGNPVECLACSTPQCVAGESFYVACTHTADAYCAECSECPVGYSVLRPCTIGTNTTCVECSAELLPNNASWTASGCKQWRCDGGFYLDPSETRCIACKQPSDCLISDSYQFRTPGCGICVACNASLLLPMQCFNGDGQCGTTYWCGWTTTTHYLSTTVVTSSSTVALSTSAVLNQTVFAAVMTIVLPANASISLLSKQISCAQCIQIRVLSVTIQGVVTYCSASGCGIQRRRLLAITPISVDVGLVTSSPLVSPPVVSPKLGSISISITPSYAVSDMTVLTGESSTFSTFVASMNQPSQEDSISPMLWYILSLCCLLLVAAMCISLSCRWHIWRNRALISKGESKPFDWSGVRVDRRMRVVRRYYGADK